MGNVRLVFFFCFASLLFSSATGAEQDLANVTKDSKQTHLIQKTPAKENGNVEETNSKSSDLPDKATPLRYHGQQENDVKTSDPCSRHRIQDTIRALKNYRMSAEAVLRFCFERKGTLASRTWMSSLPVLKRSARSVSLSKKSDMRTKNNSNRVRRRSKISKRSVADKYEAYRHKRQPLDRIDEPDDWRDKVVPKYLRDVEKRQPLDRIDEPDDWRDKVEPKYLRDVQKRQPLDRIDEPDDWRDKVVPKYLRDVEKRQPLDRIDEPDDWRDKVEPKYLRDVEKRQPLDRIDEPDDWRDKVESKYLRDVQKRQPLDRIDEPDDWRDKVEPKYIRV